jgi:uncharacterized membrane protein YcaP (DUF421 family)
LGRSIAPGRLPVDGPAIATHLTIMDTYLRQAGLALVYYAALVLLMRLAGKRFAGQTTTFDLIVLISLSVTLQSATFKPGPANAVVFVITVYLAHLGLARLCARSRWVRRLVRGTPRPLVWRGEISDAAMVEEGLTRDELMAGLRKLGFADVSEVRLATLEETGHISAVPFKAREKSY